MLLSRQVVLAKRNDPSIPAVVLLLEHPPVISVGNSGNDEDLQLSEDHLKKLGFTVERSDRGGQVTYHGPGQLVVYPVLDLRRCHKPQDVGWYLDALVNSVVELAERYGVPGAGKSDHGVGVWLEGRTEPSLSALDPKRDSKQEAFRTQDRKLAAIGAKLSRWTTTHGAAVNINTNLDAFDLIVPCGMPGRPVTSLSRERALSGHLPKNDGKATLEAAKSFTSLSEGTTLHTPSPGLDMEEVSALFAAIFTQHLKLSVTQIRHLSEDELAEAIAAATDKPVGQPGP